MTASGLGKGEEVVRREPEVGGNARCCVKVATRRLLGEQIAAVVVPGKGEKNDAIWHAPQMNHRRSSTPPAKYTRGSASHSHKI